MEVIASDSTWRLVHCLVDATYRTVSKTCTCLRLKAHSVRGVVSPSVFITENTLLIVPDVNLCTKFVL